jgi:hypothetical protein
MTTPTPWAVQVLTTDYLVDGQIDPDIRGHKFFFTALQTSKPAGALILNNVKVQPTSTAEAPSPATATWLATFNTTLVAVIGRDNTACDYIVQHAPQTPVAAELRVGPYAIRGTLLLPVPANRMADVLGSFGFAMQNAEIDCVVAGSKLRGLKAPALMISTALLQGALFGR